MKIQKAQAHKLSDSRTAQQWVLTKPPCTTTQKVGRDEKKRKREKDIVKPKTPRTQIQERRKKKPRRRTRKTRNKVRETDQNLSTKTSPSKDE